MADYPEHEKLQACKDVSSQIGEFVEVFLSGKGIVLAHNVQFEGVGERLTTLGVPKIERLLAEFFEIDYDELMAEKDRMLEAHRVATSQ